MLLFVGLLVRMLFVDLLLYCASGDCWVFFGLGLFCCLDLDLLVGIGD